MEPGTDRAAVRAQYADRTNLDARSSLYEFQVPRHDLVAELVGLLPPPEATGTVLDVGCGRGQYLAGLRSAGHRAAGVDLSPGLAATAGATGAGTAVADATALPLAEGSLGAALALHVLYHLPDPAAGLRELRRVVRPGGRIVVLTNGVSHLATFRDLFAEAAGASAWLPWSAAAFTLDDQPLVEAELGPVRRLDLRGEITLTAPEPLCAYAGSVRELYEPAVGPPWDEVMARFAELVRARLRRGPLRIGSHSGFFVADR